MGGCSARKPVRLNPRATIMVFSAVLINDNFQHKVVGGWFIR